MSKESIRAAASAPRSGAMRSQPDLTEPFEIGGVRIANRVLLAPLAGIGNWFVRLQARRHGAGLAVSEMVSSFGLHYRNARTLEELLRLHPDEHPVSIQLFGQDPEVMRSAAERASSSRCGWPRRPAWGRSASTHDRRRPTTRASRATRWPASSPAGS